MIRLSIIILFYLTMFCANAQQKWVPVIKLKTNSLTYFYPYKYVEVDGKLGVNYNDNLEFGIGTGYNFNLGLEAPPITDKYKWNFNIYSIFATYYFLRKKTFQPGLSCEIGNGFNFKNLGSKITFGPRALQTEYFYTDADILGTYDGIKYYYAVKFILQVNLNSNFSFGADVGFKNLKLDVIPKNENDGLELFQYGVVLGFNLSYRIEKLSFGKNR